MKMIGTKVSTEDYEKIKAEADRANVSLTQLLRRWILERLPAAGRPSGNKQEKQVSPAPDEPKKKPEGNFLPWPW